MKHYVLKHIIWCNRSGQGTADHGVGPPAAHIHHGAATSQCPAPLKRAGAGVHYTHSHWPHFGIYCMSEYGSQILGMPSTSRTSPSWRSITSLTRRGMPMSRRPVGSSGHAASSLQPSRRSRKPHSACTDRSWTVVRKSALSGYMFGATLSRASVTAPTQLGGCWYRWRHWCSSSYMGKVQHKCAQPSPLLAPSCCTRARTACNMCVITASGFYDAGCRLVLVSCASSNDAPDADSMAANCAQMLCVHCGVRVWPL